MRMVARPQIVATTASGKCYAAISWEFSQTAADGKTYFTDRYEIWDVTNDAAPVERMAWLGKDPNSSGWNHFGGQLSVSGTNVAWMKYSDVGGPCATKFFVHGDTNLALTSLSDWGNISTNFPSMQRGSSNGWLDWTQTVSRGVGVGGALLATWA
jgi:hypothetical protein